MEDEAKTEERRADTEPLSILLIDDSPGGRRFLARMLETLGLNVVGEASNGQDGLALYRELRPDLVFLDMVMPGMTGVEVLRQIRDTNPEAMVVILTAMASRESVIESKEAGAFAYLLKPFQVQQVKAVVNKVKQSLGREGAK
jgi:two-component system chemotaxis response regulator CheY